MENEKVKSDLGSSMKQLLATIIITALFALAGFILSIVFGDNSYPIDRGYIVLYPDEWAAIFLSYFIVASVVYFFINIIALMLAVYKKGGNRRSGAWFLWLIISLLVGIGFGATFFIKYPEDTWCIIVALVMFVAAPVLTFIISTLFASDMWRMGYNPFSR